MMFNPQSSASSTLTSRETLLSMLERLPGALFVVDDAATIVYANASAQAITGAPREELLAHPFWRSAPQLVSASLYQAVLKTRQTQEPTEVEYWSPMTQTRLHVQLAPAMGGLTLQFHERREPARRQETIPQGEHLFSEGLDGLHAHIGLLTPEGMLLEINETPLKDAHIRREQAIGKPLAQAPWWSCPPMSQEHVRQAIARAGRGETVRFDAMIHLRNGMNLDLEATITPHVDPDHHIEYLIYAATDVTAHKHTEDDLRALIDAIPQLVWMMRPDGSCDYCNQRWCDATTMTAQQAQGDGWLQAIHPDDRQRVLAMWQTSVHTGMPYEAEHRLRQGTSGDYRWFLARGMPHKDAQGRILKWFGTCTDIEEQKQAEQRIKASEENFRLLAETVPQFVWVARPDGQFEYTNQRWCTYTGLTLEPGQSDQWAHRQCIHPDDREGNRVRCQHSLETGEMFEHEHRVRNGQTGEYRWFLTRGMPVHDKTGQLVKWFGTGTDIHEKKQAEDKIRALIDAIPHFVWIAGPDGYITYNNQRLIDYLAMPLEQVKGDGWMAGVHPDDRQRVWGAWQTAIQTGVLYEVEHRLQEGTSGAYRWFLVRGMPQRNAEGTILHWVGTCTDINEQKQAEQQLKESEENWRVLAETVPHLVWAVRPDGRLEYANQRACGYIGASPTYMPGEEWRQCLHPQDYERVQAVRRHALETGELYEIEYRLKESHTGAYRWFLGRGAMTQVRSSSGLAPVPTLRIRSVSRQPCARVRSG